MKGNKAKKTGSQLNQQHLCKNSTISLTVILEIPDTCFSCLFSVNNWLLIESHKNVQI